MILGARWLYFCKDNMMPACRPYAELIYILENTQNFSFTINCGTNVELHGKLSIALFEAEMVFTC